MISISTVFIGFILTGLIGNSLLLKWQQRNWLTQQRFLGHEKEYLALKELVDEVASLLGVRLYQMQRLTLNLVRSSEEQFSARAAEYDQAVKIWNEHLASFIVRLVILAPNSSFAYKLDSVIQRKLRITGQNIDALVHQRRDGCPVEKKQTVDILEQLDSIKAKARNFNKDLLDFVERRRKKVYYGEKILFSQWTLNRFSTWQLFKALFIREINSYSIICPALDL